MITKSSRITSVSIVTSIYLLAFMVVHLLFPYLALSNTMLNVLVADVMATIVVFIFSMIFNNSSVYDPYWSVVPPVIVVHLMMIFPEGNQWRQYMILALVLFWSLRLTINWIRGWHGLGEQDWRYSELSGKTGKWYWVVSFLGIHLMPTILVFLGCLPLWLALSSEAPFSVVDVLAAIITVSAILTEWIADEQLKRFKKKKQSLPFINKGLWAYSRHPNYLGEIVFWGGLFLFTLSSYISEDLWYIVGFVAMLILFKFISIPMMEKRNIKNKPGYSAYVKEVPALFPVFYKRSNPTAISPYENK